MIEIQWDDQNGWYTPVLKPFQNLSIHPFNSTLHYALECFEGMKAYRDKKGKIRLFRPEKNVERFLSSCERVTLPSFCEKELLELIKTFTLYEKDWVSEDQSSSLYLRPFAISMANYLGVEVPNKAAIYLTATPVSSYFGSTDIKLMVDETYWRGSPKGAS